MGVEVQFSKLDLPMEGQGRLIYYLIHKWGGYAKMGKALGLSRQTVFCWRKMGYIPLADVGFVSRMLAIRKEALNFTEVAQFVGSTEPWEDVVRSLDFNHTIKNEILSLPEPSVPFGVLVTPSAYSLLKFGT